MAIDTPMDKGIEGLGLGLGVGSQIVVVLIRLCYTAGIVVSLDSRMDFNR